MNKNGYSLWLIGQIASVAIGIAVGINNGAAIGLATGYALCILVDIRQQTTPNAKAVGLDAAGGQSHTSDGLCSTGHEERK